MLNVLSIQAGADTAGIGFALSQAFDGHPEIEFRSVVRGRNYLRYPETIPWYFAGEADDYEGTSAYVQWDAADLVHLHGNYKAHRLITTLGGRPAKPIVLHHHGSKYRANPAAYDAAVAEHPQGAIAVAATLDLLNIGPHLTWVPHPVRIDDMAAHRKPNRGTGRRLRVAHSPTNRAIKSTDAFLAACARVNVEPVLIEGRTWQECLTIKGTCDVMFDQVILGYGVSSIEAWAMGLPVIAGAAPQTLDRMTDEFGSLPFCEATVDTIADALDQMKDAKVRATWARKGKAHVKRWHDGRETVARLTNVYEALLS